MNIQMIAHRRNTIKELNETPANHGIEVDIRSDGKELIIHHDPLTEGELFLDWIRNFRHKTLILNVKEEGLEPHLIQIMKDNTIEDYFFLDQSFPFMVRWSIESGGRSAVRVSEYESLDTALALQDKVSWVWVDYFTKFPLTSDSFTKLKSAKFKICLVSPELQGFDGISEIPRLCDVIRNLNIIPDAVCTKLAHIWDRNI